MLARIVIAVMLFSSAVAPSADASAPLNPKSPLPDWGKAEGLMSLAFAHMLKSTPDLKTSAAEAQAALKLEPRWHYVRDVLIPQIAAAAKKAEETKQ